MHKTLNSISSTGEEKEKENPNIKVREKTKAHLGWILWFRGRRSSCSSSEILYE
jgi:hypothetical protein